MGGGSLTHGVASGSAPEHTLRTSILRLAADATKRARPNCRKRTRHKTTRMARATALQEPHLGLQMLCECTPSAAPTARFTRGRTALRRLLATRRTLTRSPGQSRSGAPWTGPWRSAGSRPSPAWRNMKGHSLSGTLAAWPRSAHRAWLCPRPPFAHHMQGRTTVSAPLRPPAPSRRPAAWSGTAPTACPSCPASPWPRRRPSGCGHTHSQARQPRLGSASIVPGTLLPGELCRAGPRPPAAHLRAYASAMLVEPASAPCSLRVSSAPTELLEDSVCAYTTLAVLSWSATVTLAWKSAPW
jgi:hypothetical protein